MDDELAQQESDTNTIEQALSVPVTIPFGLPCRDEAGWRWNADKENIPVDMETTLTSSMEERTVAFFESRWMMRQSSSSPSAQNTR